MPAAAIENGGGAIADAVAAAADADNVAPAGDAPAAAGVNRQPADAEPGAAAAARGERKEGVHQRGGGGRGATAAVTDFDANDVPTTTATAKTNLPTAGGAPRPDPRPRCLERKDVQFPRGGSALSPSSGASTATARPVAHATSYQEQTTQCHHEHPRLKSHTGHQRAWLGIARPACVPSQFGSTSPSSRQRHRW